MQKEERMILYAYSIMENHMHLTSAAVDLSKQIGNFKSYTARKMIDFLSENKAYRLLDQLAWHKARHKQDRDHQLWQEGSHPELIQGEEMMRQKIDYIHNNPVKRGYVDLPTHWRYSSARNYEGLEGLIPVTTQW
jgi:REP element-mobilizing transposase RayT